ncbi:unnamed protein product [Polarella glacialis]|uniref:Protein DETOXIFICATION n=2 Tax=Polarella glacialis TaxID=89957 RepID=A0A813JNL9_POLGL|nr:unnamed protein product [Polarella glacialis]
MAGASDARTPCAAAEWQGGVCRRVLRRLSRRGSDSARSGDAAEMTPSSADVVAPAAERQRSADAGEEAPPYSARYEIHYFFGKGIALGLSSLLNWGIPPLVAMIFAGHTANSAQLQASLGYGRVWYNCTVLMPCVGMMGYCSNVFPGCIGAGRADRIPRYLQRGIALSLLIMIPLFVLQIFSDHIMHALGVPPVNAHDVGVYCRIMVLTAIMTILDGNIESAFVNLGYARSATLNSFVCGIGIDIGGTFLLIYKWDMGVEGAALAQLGVGVARVTVWGALAVYYGLVRKLFVAPAGSEKLFPPKEVKVFLSLAAPQILSNFAGWAIFEFQLMALANIAGITQDALAAGAVWVQIESSLAAAQDGWIRTTSMRSLVLLGKQDPGARKAFRLFTLLASAVIAVSNVFLFIFQDGLCKMVSNDEAVREWLGKIVWVLTIHTQTRILSINASFLFIPLGKGFFGTCVTFVCFYLIGSPISAAVGLTDWFTTSVATKMIACVGTTSIAQIALSLFGFEYMRQLDWLSAGAIINQRANNDKQDLAAALMDVEQQPMELFGPARTVATYPTEGSTIVEN